METQNLRPFWRNFFTYHWKFGLLLILLLGIPRFIIVLDANITGNYRWVSIIFMVMWIIPFILLNKKGQKSIGIRKPQNYKWLLYSLLIGIAFCSVMFVCTKLFWVSSMFVLGQILFKCKQMTGSIWEAVAGHAGYNLGMIYWIFYHIF